MRFIVLLFAFFIFFFVRCSDGVDKGNKSKVDKKVSVVADSVPKAKPQTVLADSHKDDVVRLTDENVVGYLTEYGQANPENRILLKTNLGSMEIKLYDETPLHRANFIRLIKNKYYDEAFFYRVVKGFIIQTGNSDKPVHSKRRHLLGKYSIPAEFRPNLIHKRGAVSMSRDYKDNPEKKSSPYDFFIVHGTVLTGAELKVTTPEFRKNIYGTIGGADHLDGEHTVFGEVVKGFDVIDKIATTRTDRGDWPYENIVIEEITIL